MRTFCTVITGNYLPFAVSLYQSLVKFHEKEQLVILICDDDLLSHSLSNFPGVKIIYLEDVISYKQTDRLYEKYSGQMDAFRWSMKSVLLQYLLEHGYEKVIYTDCDIFFFNDYNFLFEELDKSNVLLTPSWRTPDYKRNEEEFIHLYTDGLYNTGFIGANKKAIPALEWWSHVCSYNVTVDYEHGLHDDQKYLDAMPVFFENIHVLKHKGCNIALWNQIECRRIAKNGQLLINGVDPVIFVHFHRNYIKELKEGNDPLLYPYFKRYESIFAESGFVLNDFIAELPFYKEPGLIKTFKQKTLLRTRFKYFMHKLIDKI